MSFLVTETSSDQPSALVISDQHALKKMVVEFLRQANFKVVEWGRAEVLAARKNPTEAKSFDKIFVILLGNVKEVVGEVSEVLKDVRRKTSVVAPYTSPFVSKQKIAQDLVVQTKYLADFSAYVQITFAEANVFLLEDVLYPNEPGFYFEQWWSKLLEISTKTIFSSPSAFIYPQTLEQAWLRLQKSLFSPKKGELYLIRGVKISLAEVCEIVQQETETRWKHIYQLHNLDRPEKEMLSAKTLVSAGIKKNEFIQEFLRRFVSNFHQGSHQYLVTETVLPENEEVFVKEEPHRDGVVPPQIPQIENRMKKYEKKMSEVAHRHSLRPLRKSTAKNLNTEQKTGPQHPSLAKTPTEKALEEEISRIFGTERVQKKVEQTKYKVKVKKHSQQKNRYRSVVSFLMAVVLGISLGVLAMWGGFLMTKKLVVENLTTLAEKSQNEVPLSDTELQQLSDRGTRLSQVLSFEVEAYRVVFGAESLPEETLVASLSASAPDVYALSSRFREAVTVLTQQFLGQKQGDPQEGLNQVMSDSEDAYKKLSVLQNQVKTYADEVDDQHQAQLLTQFGSKIQEQRKLMATQIQLQQILPTLLGFNGKKTYAVLLQNNQELRPTGGFLQAIAIVTVDNGLLVDSQVLTVSDLDKAMSGQVAPPPEIQAYLGEKNWMLRDANWDPDFPQTAQQVQWFLQRILGKKVDGVIGVNLYVLQNILKQTGPVSLSEYNETLTEKNFFDRVEFHSEIKLVESGKRDYLSTVLEKILKSTSATPAEKIQPLLGSLYSSLKNGQAMIFIDQPDKNALLNSLGWGGEITTPQCPSPFSDEPCITDTFYQVEANVGINKANFTLDRHIKHTVNITPTAILHQREMTFTNTSTSNAWPLGPYKAYIRFYVPELSSLQEVRVNGTILAPTAVVVKTDHAKKYFGVSIEVPVGQSRTLTLSYTEPQTSPKPFSYVFFEQKQPGTGDDPYTLSVQYPPDFHPAVIAPQAEVKENSVTFTNVRDKNLFMGLKFNE